MNERTSCILFGFTLLIAFSAPALAQNTHIVLSNKPFLVEDGVTHRRYTALSGGDAIFAWTQTRPRAFAQALGVISPALNYDFMLVTTTRSDADSISGRWVVRRNGIVVCNNCIGKVYGLSQPANVVNYLKIYVGTPLAYAEKWHYSGYLTSRFDF